MGGVRRGRWVEVVGDGDRASSASANGHWPGALKPLPVLLMTRPVLVSWPRTPGCRGLGYFPRAGRGFLRHSLGLPTRGVGAPRAPPLLCAATTSARATSVDSTRRGDAGSPARTSSRGHSAPGPTRAVRSKLRMAAPGRVAVPPRGAAEAAVVAAGSSPGPREEEREEEGKEEEEKEREAFSAQTSASWSGHGYGDTPLVAPPLWKGV